MFNRPKNDTPESKTSSESNAAGNDKAPRSVTPGQPGAPSSQNATNNNQTSNKETSMNNSSNTSSASSNTDKNAQNKPATQPATGNMSTPASNNATARPAGPSGEYQRTPAATPNAAPGMPSRPTYPGSSYAAPGAAAASSSATSASPYGSASTGAQADDSNRKLVISRGITLSGEIEACHHLVVEGTVEATLKGAEILDITESGAFFGAVEIEEATIAGKFDGNITVRGRLTVKSTGEINGQISYKELAVEVGGTIDGEINPIGSENKAKKDSRRPSNDKAKKKDSDAAELPFSGNKQAAAG